MKLLRFLYTCLLWLVRAIGWSGAIGAGVAATVVIAVYVSASSRLDTLRERVTYVQKEVVKLDREIEEVKALREAIAAAQARKVLVEQLHPNRAWPVRLFDALVDARPEGVFFGTAEESGGRMHLSGYAKSYADVMLLVDKLESPVFSKPWLVEVVTETTPRRAGYPVRFVVGAFLQGRQQGPNSAMTGLSARPGDPK